ncbi:MAG: mannitol system or component [Ilumatobacteraceae bacterium]
MESMPYSPMVEGTGAKATIQRLGGYLAGMIMPNIGAFIAWGLITALFIPTGWIPSAKFAALVGPIILYLLPILIGYTGGRMVHGQRGAVAGAIGTMGVVVGTDIPMFLGAMIVGPLTAFLVKLFDKQFRDKIKAGFEMLVDNFSLGIISGAMAVLGVWVIGPAVRHVTSWLGSGVEKLVSHHVIPLASLIVEPAKVLFLNNAINHGVLDPIGASEALSKGKSIMFMIETNPGPGLGILLAYWFFGPRALRPSAPAAIIIHFFGGIHEIYFPYVLMKPRLILAAIAGGMSGIAIFSVTKVGLVASPSPGSIFAYITETPKGNYFGVLLGVVVSAGVSLTVASALLGFGRLAEDVDDLEAAREQSAANKQASKLTPAGATAAVEGI